MPKTTDIREALLAGLRQWDERPSSDDTRFADQAAGLADEDCFDLDDPTPAQNAFCPTGAGGGQDNSCSSHPGAEHGAEVKVKKTKERAFDGEARESKTPLTKQETGRVGEAVALAWLKMRGMTDARPMNRGRTNFPIDLIEDHSPTEVKAGLASNGKDAQKWRLTFSKTVKGEKETYEKMSESQRTAWNAEKQQRIRERKESVMADLEKELGKEVHPKTIGVIIDPDRKVADIYEFQGFHDIIRWNHESTKAAYRGSVKYDHK